MVAIVSVIVFLVLSLMVVRIATVALMLTGLSKDVARFQARSAFTGTGFVSSETESVVEHPVRRRIIMWLMLCGNAGIITVVSSLILSFVNPHEGASFTLRLTVLVGGLFGLWLFAHSELIDRWMSALITKALKQWTKLETHDFASLLHLSGNYSIAELEVDADDWLANRSLKDLNVFDEGILVLGIEKPSGAYLGAPRGSALIEPGDKVLLYGPRHVLTDLDNRRSGEIGEDSYRTTISRQQHHLREVRDGLDSGLSQPTMSSSDS